MCLGGFLKRNSPLDSIYDLLILSLFQLVHSLHSRDLMSTTFYFAAQINQRVHSQWWTLLQRHRLGRVIFTSAVAALSISVMTRSINHFNLTGCPFKSHCTKVWNFILIYWQHIFLFGYPILCIIFVITFKMRQKSCKWWWSISVCRAALHVAR